MIADPVAAFVTVSAALTGFTEAELWGTGQVDAYLGRLTDVAGADVTGELLETALTALKATDPKTELRLKVLDDEDLGPVARNAMVMWYLGQWDPMPATWRERHGMHPEDDALVVSAAAWRAGLVWPAIGSHPMGAQPTGFGSWAEPPRTGP